MLARRLTTILPAMTLAEALDTTRIYRVAGRTGERTAFVSARPCRAPHHTISDVGLIGGGQIPMPGEVSLAHRTSLGRDEWSAWVSLIRHPTPHLSRLISACPMRELFSSPWLNGKHIPLDATVQPP